MPMGVYPRATVTERFWAKVHKGIGCWEWTADIRGGYGSFWAARAEVLRIHREEVARGT